MPRNGGWPLVGAAAALLLLLTGCKGTGSEQSIEVAAVWTGEEQRAFSRVLEAFQEQTKIRVVYTSTGDDIAAVLGTRIQGGKPPDVAILPQPGLLGDLALQGALHSIQGVAGAEVDRRYAPIWRRLGSVDGTLYGVWFKGANKSLVWYNVHVFQNAGVHPPDTWEKLLGVAKTILDSGVAPSREPTAGRSPTGSRMSTSGPPVPNSTTSSRATRSPGRTPASRRPSPRWGPSSPAPSGWRAERALPSRPTSRPR